MGSRAPLYEPLPSPELLNNKITAQAAEIERLLMENKKLAATNSAMRKEVSADLQEIQRIKSYIGSIHTESDIHVRALIEKLRKIDDIRATEMLKEELGKAQEEAKALASTKQKLTHEHQNLTEESIKAAVDAKMLPELLVELEKLKQEHQSLRVAFEHEKGSNLKQVEHMRGLEKNWMSLAREVEKLRADITNAKRVEHTASPYPPATNYGNPTPLYPQARRAVGYDPTLVANSNAGTAQGNSAPYSTQPYAYSTNQGVDGYLRPHV